MFLGKITGMYNDSHLIHLILLVLILFRLLNDFFLDHATLVAAMPGSPDVELGANEDHLEELLRKRN